MTVKGVKRGKNRGKSTLMGHAVLGEKFVKRSGPGAKYLGCA